MRASSPPAVVGAEPGHGLRVAVAEDDPDLRALVADVLRERGFDVLEAGDGASLLRIARRGDLALVVTDLWMPSLTGGDVIHTRRREGDETPFVVITAAPAWITEQVAGLDAVTILRKPFSIEALVGAVEDVLASLDQRGR